MAFATLASSASNAKDLQTPDVNIPWNQTVAEIEKS